jgi:hypothetical protein
MACLSFNCSGVLFFYYNWRALSVRNFCPNFKNMEIAVKVSFITLSPSLYYFYSLSDNPCWLFVSSSSFTSSYACFYGIKDYAYDISVIIFFLNAFVIFFRLSLSIGYADLTINENSDPSLSVPTLFICDSISTCTALVISGLYCSTFDIFTLFSM